MHEQEDKLSPIESDLELENAPEDHEIRETERSFSEVLDMGNKVESKAKLDPVGALVDIAEIGKGILAKFL